MIRRLVDAWVNRPALDYDVVCLAVAVGFVLLPAESPSTDNQGIWFQTLAAVTGVLLGLGGVALTVVFAVAPSDRLKRVYDATGPRLAQLVVSCLGALCVVTVGFAALFLLSPPADDLRNAATAGLVVLAALRFSRLWWIFRRVLFALMTRSSQPSERQLPSERWVRPRVDDSDYSIGPRHQRSTSEHSKSTRGQRSWMEALRSVVSR